LKCKPGRVSKYQGGAAITKKLPVKPSWGREGRAFKMRQHCRNPASAGRMCGQRENSHGRVTEPQLLEARRATWFCGKLFSQTLYSQGQAGDGVWRKPFFSSKKLTAE